MRTPSAVIAICIGFGAALLSVGCGAPHGGSVQLPTDARLLAYGKYVPATYVPDEPGLLYYVDAASGQVVYVLSAQTRRQGGMLSAEQLPESMKTTFDPNRQYRVYFVPQLPNAPQVNPQPR